MDAGFATGLGNLAQGMNFGFQNYMNAQQNAERKRKQLFDNDLAMLEVLLAPTKGMSPAEKAKYYQSVKSDFKTPMFGEIVDFLKTASADQQKEFESWYKGTQKALNDGTDLEPWLTAGSVKGFLSADAMKEINKRRGIKEQQGAGEQALGLMGERPSIDIDVPRSMSGFYPVGGQKARIPVTEAMGPEAMASANRQLDTKRALALKGAGLDASTINQLIKQPGEEGSIPTTPKAWLMKQVELGKMTFEEAAKKYNESGWESKSDDEKAVYQQAATSLTNIVKVLKPSIFADQINISSIEIINSLKEQDSMIDDIFEKAEGQAERGNPSFLDELNRIMPILFPNYKRPASEKPDEKKKSNSVVRQMLVDEGLLKPEDFEQ